MVRYDQLGRSIAESQQVNSSVDLAWSMVEESFVDAANGNAIVPTRSMTYDTQGAIGERFSTPPSQILSTVVRLHVPTYQYGYDTRGQQTSVVDPYGNETLLDFNDLGQQTTRTLPIGAGPDQTHGSGGDDVAFF